MTTDVVRVEPTTPFRDVVRLFSEHQISAVMLTARIPGVVAVHSDLTFDLDDIAATRVSPWRGYGTSVSRWHRPWMVAPD